MGYFCTNCGNKVTNGNFCPYCGTQMNGGAPASEARYERPNAYQYPVKVKTPGTGGMVLGIIAACFLLIELIGLFGIKEAYVEYLLENNTLDYPKPLFALSFVLISSVCAIIGLSLSIAATVKQKSSKSMAGLILSILSLVGSIIVFIVGLVMLG